MKLQEALKLLKNSGYLCEFTVAAEPTFDDYKNKVYQIVADQVGQERADMIMEYEERELQDYAYRQGWSVKQGAEAVIEWTTPSEKQKEILDFMYNNWDADNERSYGPDSEYDAVCERAREQFEDSEALIPSDTNEFAVLYGKEIYE
ncbi:MAG: hypothetical protein IJH65_04500 [Methanobrevibacter sp.]|nr:hypothetical protein [Methanobrevibacter sp.]